MSSGMSPKSILITGCNRGVGLALVKQFVKSLPNATIVATCRNPLADTELSNIAKENGNVRLLRLDVRDFDSFEKFAQEVEGIVGPDGLNLLLNNAGLLHNKTLDSVTPDDMLDAYKVNCMGPLFLTRALLPLLKKATRMSDSGLMSISKAAVIQMSTAVASIAENSGGSKYAYRCSKVALNMAMKNLSIDLKAEGILVMAMHPGWVLTDMGGPNALISTETCASEMFDTLQQLSEKDHGTFLRYNNTSIQW